MNWDYIWVFIVTTSALWLTYFIVILGNHLINKKEHKALSEHYKQKAKEYNELITQKESINGIQRSRSLSRFNQKSETKSQE
jgi:hypothetical protein